MGFGFSKILFKKDGTNKEKERMNNFVSDIVTSFGRMFYALSIQQEQHRPVAIIS